MYCSVVFAYNLNSLEACASYSGINIIYALFDNTACGPVFRTPWPPYVCRYPGDKPCVLCPGAAAIISSTVSAEHVGDQDRGHQSTSERVGLQLESILSTQYLPNHVPSSRASFHFSTCNLKGICIRSLSIKRAQPILLRSLLIWNSTSIGLKRLPLPIPAPLTFPARNNS